MLDILDPLPVSMESPKRSRIQVDWTIWEPLPTELSVNTPVVPIGCGEAGSALIIAVGVLPTTTTCGAEVPVQPSSVVTVTV